MDRSHPIPQNVTAFEFHLVGDMTLKQFGYLALGMIIAYFSFILLASSLPLLAWPLTFFSAILGIAFAFIPISDRPLDHWVGAFLKAVYSPTRRTWRKNGRQYSEEPMFMKRLAVLNGGIPTIQEPSPTLTTLATPAPVSQSPTPPRPQPLPSPEVSPTPTPIPVVPATFIPGTRTRVTVIPSPKPTQITLTTIPNVINGIIVDSSGNYLENVVVVIYDKEGLPVRALKTNKLGQFSGSTPLPNGTYTIDLERDNLVFDSLQIELTGKILPPLQVAAKKLV